MDDRANLQSANVRRDNSGFAAKGLHIVRFWCLALVLVSLVACDSQPKAEQPPPVSIPLEVDPTEKIELARWWSNGTQLLRLDQTGHYALYQNNNRYRQPLEIGRWRRGNYATVWLDPYVNRGPSPPSSRGELRRVGRQLTLDIPASGPRGAVDGLMQLERAPIVVEDRMLGEWSGEGGTLLLSADGRYRYSAPFGSGMDMGRVAGHDGRWVVENEQVVLLPDYGGTIAASLILEQDVPLRVTMPDGELRPTRPMAGATVP
jgi:hypothetical protein